MVALLREIRSQGLTVSMDCQFDPTLEWTGENGNLAHFLPLVDVFLPNEHEAMSITRTESVAEAAEALSRMMPQGAVLVKNGGKGVLVKLPREESVCVPAFKAETVVDTTGAGDSFNAGFLSSWVREKRGEKREIIKNWLNSGKRLMTAAAFGCAAANLCVQSVGAFVQGIDFSKVKNVVEEGKFAE